MSRYIHGNWEHLSQDDGRSMITYIVIDRNSKKLVSACVRRRLSETKWEFVKTSQTLFDELSESILSANSDCLIYPEDFGLDPSAEMPSFVPLQSDKC